MTNLDIGFISIRNEDGTAWYNGKGEWSSRRGRRAVIYADFLLFQSQVARSTAQNCPDNGFFGLMNLKWHPTTLVEAKAQNVVADQFEQELLEEYI